MKRIILSAMPLLMAAMAANAQSPSLSEGFEGSDVPPSGWTMRACTDASTNKYKWESVAYGSDPLKYRSGYTHGGEKCMMVSSGKTTSAKPAPDSWLITPQVAVASGDNLSFMLAYAPVYNDNAIVPADKRIKFAVLVSTTGTDAADFTETLMEIAPYGETDWRKHVLSLDKYAGKNIYIAFREYGSYDKGAITLNRLWIDDVVVGKTSSSDLVATQLLSPVAGPKTSQNISFSYTNSGMPATGLKASYKVNDGDIVSETLDPAATCATGETLDFTFAAPATLNAGQENIVKVWMEAENDGVHENDTLTQQVSIDNMFQLPYEMNSGNLDVGWSYTYHNGNLNRGTNAGWWQVPDDSFTKLTWTYKLCSKESILEGKWFQLPKGKLNVAFNYASGTEAPLTLVFTNCDTGETTEAAYTLPASTEAADTKTSVSIPADGLYKLGVKMGAEYAGPLSLNSLSLSQAVPGDVAVKAIKIPTAVVTDEPCPVVVTVANYGEEKAESVPVKVTLDGTLVAEGAIPSIDPGQSVDYTVENQGSAWGLSLFEGTHTLTVATALEDDADTSNDSMTQEVFGYSKPAMPFADSFVDESGSSKRWTMENLSDNVLNWNIGTSVSNGIDWSKDGDSRCAYMSSVSGAEHNAVLRSPVITVGKACDVRLSYYYTTRMYSAEAGAETYLTAKVNGVSSDVASYSAERKDTIADANVRAYRQGYLLCHLPAAGDYQISFLNTGKGHDIVLDDVRFNQESDLAIVDAKQTAASGYNNTVNTVTVKVANHGAEAVDKFRMFISSGNGSSMKDYAETLNPGDTLTCTLPDIDISNPGTYAVKAEVAITGDGDAFNNIWQLAEITTYANATLPYVADFDTEEQQSQWQLGGTWQTGKYSSASAAYNGTGAISHHKKAASADGDWAFSGCIEIPAGTYDLSFFYRTFLNGKTANLYAQNFALCLGKEPTAEGMTQTLYVSDADVLAPGKRYKKVSKAITVAEDGKYYLGVKCASTSSYGVLYIDNVSIAADETQPVKLTTYVADYADWHAYDPSDQFSQWTVEADGSVINTTQNIFNAGNPQTELPGLIVSPAMEIEEGAVVSAEYSYRIQPGNASNINDEEMANMQANLYVARQDNPDAFTTLVASGANADGHKNTATGSFVASEGGTYYFAIGVSGAQNCISDSETIDYDVYSVKLSAVVDGIQSVQTLDGSAVELYGANGMSLGKYQSMQDAMKHCPQGGVYVVKSGSATMKVVR